MFSGPFKEWRCGGSLGAVVAVNEKHLLTHEQYYLMFNESAN
jgi:hypothetical protein